MYRDTVSLAVSSLSFFASCVSSVARALPLCCLVVRTHVSPDVLSQGPLSKVPSVESSQLEGIPCHEWRSVLLGSTHLSLSVGVDQVGNLVLSRVAD